MKNIMKLSALALSAVFVLGGCDSSSSSNGTDGAKIDMEKLFFFYNHNSQEQYTYETDHDESKDLNSDATSPFYMSDKVTGRLIYWADEISEGEIDEKVLMLKASYNFAVDGNLTDDNLIYLGHFHDEELVAHSADEFSTENIDEKKVATLKRVNLFLAEQEALKEEIAEAMTAESEELCNYFVPHHEEHDDHEDEEAEHDDHEDEEAEHEDHEDEEAEHEDHEDEEKVQHYALSKTGKLYVFVDGESGLEKVNSSVILDGASECLADESGITSAGEDGVFVYLKSTRTLYLVDAHDADYHQHSQWKLDELLPSSFEATQMIGFGSGAHEEHNH